MPDDKIDLLDHGFVRLIDSMGGDLSISRAARVSYDAAWRAGEDKGSDARLISYLWKNGHTSPFEAVSLTFEVKAPVFVFRQWHRHRTWAYNELSARYRELPEEYYVPDHKTIGTQSTSNKQMRDFDEDGPDEMRQSMIAWQIDRANAHSFAHYRALLKSGCPREIARSVLPFGTYSHMFCTVSLLNLLKYIGLRDHEHAQYEIQVYARAMFDLAAKHVAPAACEVFRKKVVQDRVKDQMYKYLMETRMDAINADDLKQIIMDNV